MTSANSPEFDHSAELLAQSEAEQAEKEQLELITNRFWFYLNNMGIIFDAKAFLDSPDSPNAEYLDAEQVALLAHTNQLRLHILSAYKMISDLSVSLDAPDLDLKKRLQAMLIAQGCSDVWLNLVDVEFPGDPLTDADSGYIFEESVMRALKQDTNNVEFSAMQAKLTGHLSGQGKAELSVKEIEVLTVLVTNLLILDQRQNIRLRGNLMENMRLLVIEQGLDLDLWNGLISKFFGSSAE